jgi:hypothetical protein
VTIKTTSKVAAGGMDVPTPDQESTIDLTKPFDPIKSGFLGQGAGVAAAPMVEKLKEGKEKLKLAGKEYEPTWTTYKLQMNGGGQQIEAEMKVWSSPKFSLYMLKTEMSVDVGGMKMEMTMELTEVGAKGK